MSGLADRRRNLGPTDLINFNLNSQTESPEANDEVRPVFVSQGIAMHATGSAYMEVGDLKLHATVHGPQQQRGSFNDQADVEVNVHIENFAGIQNKDDISHSLSDFIRSSITPVMILKEYPKSKFVISLAVINGNVCASQTAASVNVVTMALVNAGIALHDMVTAVSVSKLNDDKVFVDSVFEDATPNLKQIVAAWSVSTNKLVSMLVTSHGEVSKQDLRSLLDRARTASVQLRDLFNSFLVEDYDRSSKK